jgi:FkbM family methyltransferase
MKNKLICILFSFLTLHSMEYEGIGLFQSYGKIDIDWLPQFLPYDPLIVEAGAFRGDETDRMAQKWPQGQIHSIEPDHDSFVLLKEKIKRLENVKAYECALHDHNGICPFHLCRGMNGKDSCFGYASSVLPLSEGMEIYCKGPTVIVPCFTLDHWCKKQGLDHIDLLRLEVEGMELQVLQNATDILQKTQIIYVKTLIHPHRWGMTSYNELKSFLLARGFVLLSHWYEQGINGHAVFLSRELFDAYFKLSLGMYLDL